MAFGLEPCCGVSAATLSTIPESKKIRVRVILAPASGKRLNPDLQQSGRTRDVWNLSCLLGMTDVSAIYPKNSNDTLGKRFHANGTGIDSIPAFTTRVSSFWNDAAASIMLSSKGEVESSARQQSDVEGLAPAGTHW